MISVEQARAFILQHVSPRTPQRVESTMALGHVLAEDIASDVDSPPHDKSLVDGYAVQVADVATAPSDLRVIDEVMAGAVPRRAVTSGSAIRIMTGAPIPAGADAVVMVEETEMVTKSGTHWVRIRASRVRAGQHIMPRGTSLARGDIVLHRGHRLRPIEMGLLAEVGATNVAVLPRPDVAILVTGNELVPPGETPAPGQIRNSNGAMLEALVTRAGGRSVNLGIGRDEREILAALIRRGLERDVLVLSGGVSAGVLDLVPEVLGHLGVEQVFHKVNLKPGKPLWFGVAAHSEGRRLVFGLPGNPVSSLVCFELFVRPALLGLAGRPVDPQDDCTAVLACDHRHRSDRPTYHPARWEEVDGIVQVTPLAWKGSADLRTLTTANGLAKFPPRQHDFARGDSIELKRFEP